MDGVVYTRKWVVDLMLDMVGYTADVDLAQRVAIEPACGCGAFLGEMVTRLIESARSQKKLSPAYLRTSICAYDIDPRAAEASRALVSGLLMEAGLSENDSAALSKAWVHAGDALLADFPDADWVIGNPPYVRSSAITRERRKQYADELSCATMGTDLYVGFFEKGLSALKETGRLCFICADRWLQSRYGARLRRKMAREFNLETLVRMHGADVFEEDVSAYPAITLVDKGASDVRYAVCDKLFSEGDASSLLDWHRGKSSNVGHASTGTLKPLPIDGSPMPMIEPERLHMILDYERAFPRIEDCGVEIGIGVASGCDEVYVTKDPTIVEADRLLPIFFMRDWRAGLPQERYLVNPWNANGELVDLDAYPKLREYFSNNESKLRKRRVARENPSSWYRTLDKPNGRLSGSEMLLFPDMSSSADPVLSDGSRYPHHNCYWLISDSWDLAALGGLLMSDIAEAFIDAYGVKMRGETLRFQAQYLRMVHVPRCEDVPADIKQELADAFQRGDRTAANIAARKAYAVSREAA